MGRLSCELLINFSRLRAKDCATFSTYLFLPQVIWFSKPSLRALGLVSVFQYPQIFVIFLGTGLLLLWVDQPFDFWRSTMLSVLQYREKVTLSLPLRFELPLRGCLPISSYSSTSLHNLTAVWFAENLSLVFAEKLLMIFISAFSALDVAPKKYRDWRDFYSNFLTPENKQFHFLWAFVQVVRKEHWLLFLVLRR